MSLHAAHSLQPTPPARARWFPGRPESLSEVRRFVSEELPDRPRQDDAILLTSELATNAVEHTRSGQQDGGFLVVVERTYTEVVRITVHDSGSRQETLYVTEPGADDEHGRGLFIVDALADRWGSRNGWHGRETWFEIDN
ncbi:ATP-binding protein [Thermobifida cellulosilytica]|uniref:Histidine kinase/HSP90-like ATPase domain-containing protein n=1 Tax=Thermobifida cellulosilytica TB100 TaxID=665004 RepID=A0A147KJI6_THECS|nr:ATP-binding protein [Thermobifida cellulosilytica]KUP97411.1 hypothetical protein AC529_07025 [Thermobifida cellulosilytica TB100]